MVSKKAQGEKTGITESPKSGTPTLVKDKHISDFLPMKASLRENHKERSRHCSINYV